MSSGKALRKNKKTPKTCNMIQLPSIKHNFREQNVESWPASISLTPRITTNKSVAFLKSRTNPQNVIKNLMTNISTTNKPLLLIQMEDFIQYEMNRPINRSFNPQDINESRLEVFRECFDIFISEFSTYKPVLTQIKNEYERVIDQCLKKVHQVTIIETKLKTLQGDSKYKLNKLKESHNAELQQRDAKIDEFSCCINEMKAKHENVDKLLSDSEKEQKRLEYKVRDAQRSAKTFYREVKKMEMIAEDAEKAKQQIDSELRNLRNGHKKMTISYESVVNDLKKLQNEMDAGPSKHELEEKDRKIDKLKDKFHEYKELYQSLTDDHKNLLDLYATVTKERQEQAQQYARLMERDDCSRPVTPRPFWNKAVELKFMSKESMEGKSTDEIMSVMLTTLNQLEQKVETLQSIVTDDQLEELQLKDDDIYMNVDFTADTPKYLRYRGKIRKRRMAKRDIEKLLDGIWSKKYSRKSTEGMMLQDYLFDYLKCEYGIQSRVVEAGYSMLSALQRYRYDADCELFLTILNGELSEEVYRDQKLFLVNLHSEFQTMDKKNNNKITKTLSKARIEGLIRKLCPEKNAQNMNKLLNALDLNDPHDNVRYELLFREDRDGNQGPFLEELRDQHLSEIQDYLDEIKAHCTSEQNQYQQVTVEQIEDVFQRIDPKKPRSQINTYLCTGFGVSMVKSLAKDLLISTDTFCKKISTVLVKRSGLEIGSPSTRRGSKNLNMIMMTDVVNKMKTYKQTQIQT